MNRRPLSPAEFDAACRVIEAENPGCWVSSGYRNPDHNLATPGAISTSKHAMLPCMARDYCAETPGELEAIAESAYRQGLWRIVHDTTGTGLHTHVQGLPIGPPTLEWMQRWGER